MHLTVSQKLQKIFSVKLQPCTGSSLAWHSAPRTGKGPGRGRGFRNFLKGSCSLRVEGLQGLDFLSVVYSYKRLLYATLGWDLFSCFVGLG